MGVFFFFFFFFFFVFVFFTEKAALFFFPSFQSGDHPTSKGFLLRAEPLSGQGFVLKGSTQKTTSFYSCVKMSENHGGAPIYLP